VFTPKDHLIANVSKYLLQLESKCVVVTYASYQIAPRHGIKVSNNATVAIGNPGWYVRKASHRGSKQQ